MKEIKEDLRLLVIDEDFKDHDTYKALNGAIKKLSREGIDWSYGISSHSEVLAKESEILERIAEKEYDALLIDHGFSWGLHTLYVIPNETKTKLPIAYISVYDLDGLKKGYDKMLSTELHQNPSEFDELGIKLIRKKGETVSKDVKLEETIEGIYNFLKENSHAE